MAGKDNGGVMRTFKLDADLVEALDAAQGDTGMTRTSILHRALWAYLDGRTVPKGLPMFRFRVRREFFRPPLGRAKTPEDAYRAGYLAGARAGAEDALEHLRLSGRIPSMGPGELAVAVRALDED